MLLLNLLPYYKKKCYGSQWGSETGWLYQHSSEYHLLCSTEERNSLKWWWWWNF